MPTLAGLKNWAKLVKRDVTALSTAIHDPRVPLRARVLGIFIVGYALSPIDLIPDFIPVLGLLDDAIIVPIGIMILLRMIPSDVMAEHRSKAEFASASRPCVLGVAIVVSIWTLMILAGVWLWWKLAPHKP